MEDYIKMKAYARDSPIRGTCIIYLHCMAVERIADNADLTLKDKGF